MNPLSLTLTIHKFMRPFETLTFTLTLSILWFIYNLFDIYSDTQILLAIIAKARPQNKKNLFKLSSQTL